MLDKQDTDKKNCAYKSSDKQLLQSTLTNNSKRFQQDLTDPTTKCCPWELNQRYILQIYQTVIVQKYQVNGRVTITYPGVPGLRRPHVFAATNSERRMMRQSSSISAWRTRTRSVITWQSTLTTIIQFGMVVFSYSPPLPRQSIHGRSIVVLLVK